MPNRSPLYIFLVATFLLFFIFFLISPPGNFPTGIIFNIEEGSSLRSVSFDLEKQNIIRSRFLFEVFVIIYGGDKHVISADYLFENRISFPELARRISRGERHLAPVKVTIPEGFSLFEMADTFVPRLAYFNKDKFLYAARDKEGYLFPDTYFFFTNANEEDVLKALADNFKKKISKFEPVIARIGRTEGDIIKIASLIESESKGNADRAVISGILWKRLSIGMPLQADAAPETYKNKGLPKNPINNPGLLAIEAAIFPKLSPYLYYLHDKTGNIHYAKSFAEHRQNITEYLK